MDWKITDEYGVWFVEKLDGSDVFSFNICKLLNTKLFISDFCRFNFKELKEYVEKMYRKDKDVFNRYVIK